MMAKTTQLIIRACLLCSLWLYPPTSTSFAATEGNTSNPSALIGKAKNGDPQAQLQLGLLLMDGQNGDPAPEQAVVWFEKAASQGLHEASYQLGLAYEKGKGVEKNIPKALEHYEHAAGSRASSWPQYRIAKIYLSGEGVKKNHYKAEDWAQTVTSRDNPEGYFLLGEIYEDKYLNGDRQIRDVEEAVRYYRTAAKKGVAKGEAKADELIQHLAERFPSYKPKIDPNYVPGVKTARGSVTKPSVIDDITKLMFLAPLNSQKSEQVNPKLPLDQLKEKAASGNAQAQLILALRLLKKAQPEHNVQQGLMWMERSANNHNSHAQLILGTLHLSGVFGQKDPRMARHWLRMAAVGGDDMAAGLLTKIIAEQHGVPQMTESREFYKRFALQGDEDSQYALGYMYRIGKDGSVDPKQAVKWFQLAAEQGNRYAQSKLGFMHYKGIGVEANLAQAVKWYLAAAEQGESNAQHNLGQMYYDGKGVAKDMAKAAQWIRKSADQMLPMGVYGMGVLHHLGLGVERDQEKAYLWFHISNLQGNVIAKKMRDSIGKGISSKKRNGLEKGASIVLRGWLYPRLENQ